MKYGSHPVNLAFRFILEMILIFVAAYWGWVMHDGWLRFLMAIGLPVLLAVIWGTFAVPGDPSRSGKTLVPTPGWARLIIEIMIFGFGIFMLDRLGYQTAAYVFFASSVLHYLLSTDRIRWLIKK